MKNLYKITRIAFLFLCFLSTVSVDAQNQAPFHSRSNEVYGELWGPGGAYSLNYGRRLLDKEKVQFWTKIGGGYLGQLKALSDISDYSIISAHIETGVLWGSGRHQLEAGLSYSYIYYFDITRCSAERPECQLSSHSVIPRIGYRFYTKSSRWFFSVAWTPVFEVALVNGHTDDRIDQFLYVCGLGVGWRF